MILKLVTFMANSHRHAPPYQSISSIGGSQLQCPVKRDLFFSFFSLLGSIFSPISLFFFIGFCFCFHASSIFVLRLSFRTFFFDYFHVLHNLEFLGVVAEDP